MTTDNLYAFIFLISEKNNLKDIFFLHSGDNTIGSDGDCDIVIQLINEPVEAIHAKIIVDENFTDFGIEDISISNSIYREKDGKQYHLQKRREYELFPNRIYYLTNNVKFFLVEGNLSHIEEFLLTNELYYYFDEVKNKYKSIQNKLNEGNSEHKSIKSINSLDIVNIEDFNNFDFIPNN